MTKKKCNYLLLHCTGNYGDISYTIIVTINDPARAQFLAESFGKVLEDDTMLDVDTEMKGLLKQFPYVVLTTNGVYDENDYDFSNTDYCGWAII